MLFINVEHNLFKIIHDSIDTLLVTVADFLSLQILNCGQSSKEGVERWCDISNQHTSAPSVLLTRALIPQTFGRRSHIHQTPDDCIIIPFSQPSPSRTYQIILSRIAACTHPDRACMHVCTIVRCQILTEFGQLFDSFDIPHTSIVDGYVLLPRKLSITGDTTERVQTSTHRNSTHTQTHR